MRDAAAQVGAPAASVALHQCGPGQGVLQVARTVGRTSYTYDLAGRRIGRTLPNGVVTTWNFDFADRLSEVEHRQGTGGTILFWATSTYDPVGRRLTQTDYEPSRASGAPGGVPWTLPSVRGGPNQSGTPLTLPGVRPGPNQAGTPNVLPNSRLTVLSATTHQTFQYDEVGRLTQETRDGSPTTTWTYDATGNRESQSVGGQTTTYAYDADNRLIHMTTGSAITNFKYDANGSMLKREGPGASEILAYGWDAAGRLTQISKNGSTQASFLYDGDGNRRSKTNGAGQTTTFANDARGLSQVLQATQAGNTVTYVPGSGQYDPSQPTSAQQWGYTVSDSQNSRLLVDGAGNIGRRWEWEPFGRARMEQGVVQARFGYGGEERDDETGLINLRARYYDPAIGRFISRDSLAGAMTNAQSWNRYSYVENDPINALVPSGHKTKTKIKWPMGMDADDLSRGLLGLIAVALRIDPDPPA